MEQLQLHQQQQERKRHKMSNADNRLGGIAEQIILRCTLVACQQNCGPNRTTARPRQNQKSPHYRGHQLSTAMRDNSQQEAPSLLATGNDLSRLLPSVDCRKLAVDDSISHHHHHPHHYRNHHHHHHHHHHHLYHHHDPHHHHHHRHQRHSKPSESLMFLVLLSLSVAAAAATTTISEEIIYDEIREVSSIQQQQQQHHTYRSTMPTNDGDRKPDSHQEMAQPIDHHYDRHTHIDCPYHHSHKSQQQQQQQDHHRTDHVRSMVSGGSDGQHHDERRVRNHYHQLDHEQEQEPLRLGDLRSYNGVKESRRRQIGASAGIQRRPNSAEKAGLHYQAISSSDTAADGRPPPPPCDDCLAIPLVALVGDKQINGFIIPPTNLQRQQQSGSREGSVAKQLKTKQQHPYQQQQHHHNNGDPRRKQQQHPVPGGLYKSYEPEVVPLAPKSDENCPMTGPLTVCDHIGSYPTDIILDKLDGAKKQLGKSHFNLDSFFSDERDNSGDPFERKQPDNSSHDMTPVAVNASMRGEYPLDASANIYSHATEDNKQQTTKLMGHQRRMRSDKGYNEAGPNMNARHPPGRSSSWDQNQQKQDSAAMIHPSQKPANGNRATSSSTWMQDDFVDLVERQAISLADQRNKQLLLSQDKPSVIEENLYHGTAGDQHQRRHHSKPDRLSGFTSRNQQQQQQQQNRQHERIGRDQGSILAASNRTLSDRLIMGPAVSVAPLSNRAGGRRQSTKTPTTVLGRNGYNTEATASYDNRPEDSSGGQKELHLQAHSSQQRAQTGQPMESLDETGSSAGQQQRPPAVQSAGSRSRRGRQINNQKATTEAVAPVAAQKKAQRSRRQVGSVRVTTSSGRSMEAADAELVGSQRRPASMSSGGGGGGDSSSDSDTDNSSQTQPDSSNDDNQAEPVCRAKSIYISPRAAFASTIRNLSPSFSELNDKKQWKYVVNAAERNPQIRQIIRVDICQNPFGPCSDQVSIPFGFTSECKQKYSKKKLLALDGESGLLEVDTFFIPSCCVCQLIRTTDTSPIEDSSLSSTSTSSSSSLSPLEEPPAPEIDTTNLPPPSNTEATTLSSPLQPAEDNESARVA